MNLLSQTVSTRLVEVVSNLNFIVIFFFFFREMCSCQQRDFVSSLKATNTTFTYRYRLRNRKLIIFVERFGVLESKWDILGTVLV